MSKILLTIIIIVLVVLVGTWPLSILSKIFDYIGIFFQYLANGLDFFGWNGLV